MRKILKAHTVARISMNSVIIATTMYALPALAATYQWYATADGDWQNAANWDSAGVLTLGSTDTASRLNVLNGAKSGLAYSYNGTTTIGRFVIGSSSSGQLTLSNGTLATSSTGDIIGNNSGAGTLIINGGNYTTSGSLTLNNNANVNSVFTMASGNATIATTLTLKSGTASNSTVNLDGGTLSVATITATTGGSNVFNFNGGTLKTTGTSYAFNTINIRNGGATIDSNNKSFTITQALKHSDIIGDNASDGGLTKNGIGTLTLTGANTYTGNTTVNNGTLTLASGSELAFVIRNSNASNGITGNGAVNLNGTLKIDISQLTDTSGSWQIVNVGTLTESFNTTTFGVVFSDGTAFTKSGTQYISGQWIFDTATGSLTLSAVPEPAALGMLTCGFLAVLARRSGR